MCDVYYLEKADYRTIHVMAHFCLKKRVCTFAKEKRQKLSTKISSGYLWIFIWLMQFQIILQ